MKFSVILHSCWLFISVVKYLLCSSYFPGLTCLSKVLIDWLIDWDARLSRIEFIPSLFACHLIIWDVSNTDIIPFMVFNSIVFLVASRILSSVLCSSFSYNSYGAFFSMKVHRSTHDFRQDFHLALYYASSLSESPGVLSEKLGGGVQPASQTPCPRLWPKSSIFPAPIYDLTLTSKPCFRPSF